MATTKQQGLEFSGRLDHALGLVGIPRDRSRTMRVATLFYVSRETARLWLNGRVPALSKLREISRRLNVSLEWLATGRGAMRPSAVADKTAAYSPGDALENELFNVIRLMTARRKKALLALLTME